MKPADPPIANGKCASCRTHAVIFTEHGTYRGVAIGEARNRHTRMIGFDEIWTTLPGALHDERINVEQRGGRVDDLALRKTLASDNQWNPQRFFIHRRFAPKPAVADRVAVITCVNNAGRFGEAAWFGLLARAGTPEPIRDKMTKATLAALQDPSVRDVIRSQAAVVVGNTGAEFGQFVRAESAKYGKIVALTGVRLN